MDALNKGPQHLSLGRGRLDLQRSIAAARQAAEKRNSNGLPQARFRAATAGELLRDEAQYVSPSVRNRRAATIPLTLAQEVEAATSQYAGDSRKGLGADRALRGLIRASSERRIPAASVEIPSLNQWAEGELAIESDADGVARAKALITAAYIDIQGSTGPKPIQLNLSGLGLQSFPPLDFLRRQGVTLRIDLSDNEIQYFPLARDFFSPLRHHLRRVNVDGNPINSLIFDLSSKRMLQIMNLKGRKIQIRLPESQFGAAWTRLGFIQRNFTFLEPREDSDSDSDGSAFADSVSDRDEELPAFEEIGAPETSERVGKAAEGKELLQQALMHNPQRSNAAVVEDDTSLSSDTTCILGDRSDDDEAGEDIVVRERPAVPVQSDAAKGLALLQQALDLAGTNDDDESSSDGSHYSDCQEQH